jgi:hypothetical protein
VNTLLINNPSTKNQSGGKILNWITGLLSVFSIAFFVYYIVSYSVNFPFQDDNSLIQIITEVRKGLGWKHNLYAFFRAENDHRIFVPRLIAYFDYAFSGHLHFKSYVLIATVNLILITGFIYGLFRQIKLPFYYFLPIPLLIFQPQYHEVSIWALTGLQHATLLVILCACLILLKKPSPINVSVAIVLAFLAAFTHGNGILVFATGAFVLLIERHYKVLLPWILSMMGALAGYLFDYTPGSGVESSINWPNLPASFVAKIGANWSVWPSISIGASIIWGTLICILIIPCLLIVFFKSFKTSKSNPSINNQLFSVFCFILLTTLLITIFRASSEIVLENRFKIYAALSSVFFYLFLLNNYLLLRKVALLFFTVFAILFYFNSYALYTPEVVNKYSRSVADTYNWRKHQTELCNTSSIESSLGFLLPAYQQDYWQVPDLFAGFDELVKSTVQQKNFKPASFQTKPYLHDGNGPPQLLVEIEDFPLRRQHLRDELFVVLHDEADQRTYLAGTLPKRTGWRRLLTEGVYFANGFSTTIPLQAVRQGQYRLGCLLKKANGNSELIMTQQIVTI